ncbi:UDP-glucuronosyltransferase 2C1-like [Pristis pectinata]|uniref:UDP-glucuronosyltransferase 2C1-like n=1 Tax=Pristis pectinata TaxID=685728 RepID=UPI00223DED04|nr:UDP-glucuronosyltransferase 2C1-like [Pristis pectinata]
MSTKSRAVFLALLLFFSARSPGPEAARILAVPTDWSHWIIMKSLLLELVQREHQVTVLRNNDSLRIEAISEDFTVETIRIPAGQAHAALNEDEIHDIVFNYLYVEDGFLSSISALRSLCALFYINIEVTIPAVQAMFEDRALMGRLKAGGFDLILADPYHVAGVMMAHVLEKPLVLFGRWMIAGDLHFNLAPSPLSFVPMISSRLSDRMLLLDRLKNVLIYGISRYMNNFHIYPIYNKLCQLYLNSDITVEELYQKADIVLMKVDFAFEYPRPTVPNLVYIGGFQCSRGRPLPAELQRFMDSSGEDGVVIFSLGSVVGFLPPELASEVAAGLARLPQRVIWRFTGRLPSTLGNNTKIMSWLPQNDLLGHPKTRAFISHGGENGIYEAIYHGVPVVGIPILGDQYDNLLRLKTRGAAIMLDLAHLKRDDVFQAVKTVIEKPSYGENMKRISALHRDVPVKPKELAVFWVEYTIRHRGAAHFRSAGNELPFYQYYLLDVFVIVLVFVGLFLYLVFKLLKTLLVKVCSGRKRKQD